MPIILTCPHGGSESPPNVEERNENNTPDKCNRFTKNRDEKTNIITEGIAQKILELTGLSPYVVIARFHRKFIDANREIDCSSSSPDAKKFYQEYHERISKYAEQIVKENDSRGFLFDIHGISEEKVKVLADIYLGTGNGDTLQANFKREDIFKRHGLHGLLDASRHQTRLGGTNSVFQYRLSPASISEKEILTGGFTVREYAKKLKINCIQIEIENNIRTNEEKRSFIIEDLAFAMINFVRRHSPF